MRHRKANVKLGRTASHRDAMLRNMVTSLFEYGRISTTISKAKALRPWADRLIVLAKNGKSDLHAFRQAAAVIRKREVLDKLFTEAPTTYADRTSGYTIMAKLGPRPGDAAPMVILELIKPDTEKAKVGPGAISSAKKAKSSGGDRAKRVAAAKAAEEKKEAAAVQEPAVEEPAVQNDELVADDSAATDAEKPKES